MAAMMSWRMKALLKLVFICFLLKSSWSQCPDTFTLSSCRCSDLGASQIRITCNAVSLSAVVEALGTESARVRILAIRNATETYLTAGTFSGFTALESLTIVCSPIERIEPATFDSLANLQLLDLRDNRIRWLSRSSLMGVGSSLMRLYLDNNALQSLRSDLQPLFASVWELRLSTNAHLICDCHLSWLATFITNTSGSSTIVHNNLNCSIPRHTAITDPTLNFSSSECQSICQLGYHNCDPNADCSVLGNATQCACREGFSGDGIHCTAVRNPCDDPTACHHNATCTPNYTNQTVTCNCLMDFSGNGRVCVSIDPCIEAVCHVNASCLANGTCVCNPGFTGNGRNCLPVVIDPCIEAVCHVNASCLANGTCVCNPGFTGNGRNCLPVVIDLCSTIVCNANASCLDGSCRCNPGFTGNGRSCSPVVIDPCSSIMCSANASCLADGMCVCNPGFTGNGRNCSPVIDPCSNIICSANESCVDGSCRCNPGFTRESSICVPMPPCAGLTCHNKARCSVNTCVCLVGYTGDGYMNCLPIDPCTDVTCHTNAVCVNATCVCRENFTGEPSNCVPIDPCLGVTCNVNASCEAGTCSCLTGFTGDGQDCEQIDPCAGVLCDGNARCLDGRCHCNMGFSGNGQRCTLITPCALTPCHSNATCIQNQNEAETCGCNPGFMGNGLTCISEEECRQMCRAEEISVICSVREGSRLLCESEQLVILRNQLSDLVLNSSGLRTFTNDLAAIATNTTYFGDVPILIDLLFDTLSFISRTSSSVDSSSFTDLITVGSKLLDSSKHSLWFQLNQTEVVDHVTRLLRGLERIGEAILLQTNTSGQRVHRSDNVAVIVVRPDCESEGDFTFSSDVLSDGDGRERSGNSSIILPRSVFGMENNCSDVGIVVVIYDDVGPLLSTDQFIPNMCPPPPPPPLAHGKCNWYTTSSNCSNQTVDGVVLSASVVTTANSSNTERVNTSVLLEPVRIAFQHTSSEPSNPSCAFLNERRVHLEEAAWLTERCRVVEEESNNLRTVCECYHLTSFALLLSPTGDVSTNIPLQIVSKIGLSISIICLLITIILLFSLKLDTKKLHHIHRQLALALCLAQTLFLVGVDRTLVQSPDGVCTAIAALLHYLFLCTFSWQLVEGVHLYIFVVKVFYNERVVWLYYPLAWGLPAVVVAITLGIRFCNYGSEHFCWITEGDGANWAFHGPVLAIIVVNMVIMFIITYVIVKAAKKKENPDTCLLCTLFHASLVLVPVLGVGWVLGFFVVGTSTISEVIEWLFTIFITLQGFMLFLMHCVLNREVRRAFLVAIGCREAAKKQETVQNMRRSSMAYIRRRSSTTKLMQAKELQFNTLFFKTNKKGLIPEFSSNSSDSDTVLPGNFLMARPSISSTSRLPLIQESAEDEYSLPDSVPSTPVLQTSRNNEQMQTVKSTVATTSFHAQT